MITKPKQNDYTDTQLRDSFIQIIREKFPDITQSQIGKLVGLSREHVNRTEKKLKKKPINDPYLHNLSRKRMIRILKHKPELEERIRITKDGNKVEFTEKVYPTFTNEIEVMKEVTGRTEPKREDTPTSVTFINVNLTEARTPQHLGEPPIDKSITLDITESNRVSDALRTGSQSHSNENDDR